MKVTKDQLQNTVLVDKVIDLVADYPLYIARSNISRGEAFAINHILTFGLDNFTPFEITIKKLKE